MVVELVFFSDPLDLAVPDEAAAAEPPLDAGALVATAPDAPELTAAVPAAARLVNPFEIDVYVWQFELAGVEYAPVGVTVTPMVNAAVVWAFEYVPVYRWAKVEVVPDPGSPMG